jgi:small-conductance mechanosensitive channel
MVLTVCLEAQSERTPPPPVKPADVLDHLQRTVQWYQQISAIEQVADVGDVVSRGRLHESAIAALQLAFDYARAQAALLRTNAANQTAASGESEAASNIDQLDSRTIQRVATLQTKLNELNTALAHATARSRPGLAAQRDAVTTEIQLQKTIQTNVESIRRFAASAQSTDGRGDPILAEIDALQRNVPEARHVRTPTSAGPANADRDAAPAPVRPDAASSLTPMPSPPAFRPEAGILNLATDMIDLLSTRQQVRQLIRQTDALGQSIDKRRAPLTGEIRALVGRVSAASSASAASSDPGDSQRDLQAAASRVRALSAAVVPLSEEGIVADAASATLSEWHSDLSARASADGRSLLLRALGLLLAIAVVLAISEAWRRATFRYLREPRRRRQFLLVRRIVVGIAITLVLVIGFLSQIGSLATYAGFVTAGVAVALQNVILAVVAYFFLIGRYGVRVGDRITIGGVTGNVIEIGLVRIYLMELVAPDWRPTGRIVVFSNAVLFQPAALFKQMPGIDYAWHNVMLKLVSDANIAKAEHAIGSAVTGVFAEYRERIEAQHATFERALDVQTPSPTPDVQIRIADDGVLLTVHYPVETPRAGEIDNRILTAIRDALSGLAEVQLAPGGSPRLEAPAF